MLRRIMRWGQNRSMVQQKFPQAPVREVVVSACDKENREVVETRGKLHAGYDDEVIIGLGNGPCMLVIYSRHNLLLRVPDCVTISETVLHVSRSVFRFSSHSMM